MATFVPNYKHDIFVSYAHVDDLPLEGATQGWVTTLIHSIKIRLAQKLGRSDAFDLWMDQRLASNVKITSQISAAILIVVLSPGYIASDQCS